MSFTLAHFKKCDRKFTPVTGVYSEYEEQNILSPILYFSVTRTKRYERICLDTNSSLTQVPASSYKEIWTIPRTHIYFFFFLLIFFLNIFPHLRSSDRPTFDRFVVAVIQFVVLLVLVIVRVHTAFLPIAEAQGA